MKPIEELALKWGWLPQAQFKGLPSNWIPADDFIVKQEAFVTEFIQSRRK
ncbi:MAG: hypothetical protein V4657_07390 [Pseudomonadota bacterium]